MSLLPDYDRKETWRFRRHGGRFATDFDYLIIICWRWISRGWDLVAAAPVAPNRDVPPAKPRLFFWDFHTVAAVAAAASARDESDTPR
jgi:hypothetical protein